MPTVITPDQAPSPTSRGRGSTSQYAQFFDGQLYKLDETDFGARTPESWRASLAGFAETNKINAIVIQRGGCVYVQKVPEGTKEFQPTAGF